MIVSRQVHRKTYNTNLRLRLHLHEFVVPVGTARLTPPYLADELLHSKEDEDTSGTAETDPKQRQAALTMSFRGRGVLLSFKSVVAGGVKEDEGGVVVDSPSIHRFIHHLIDPSIHPLFHPSINHSINLSIDRSIHRLIYPSIHRSMH